MATKKKLKKVIKRHERRHAESSVLLAERDATIGTQLAWIAEIELLNQQLRSELEYLRASAAQVPAPVAPAPVEAVVVPPVTEPVPVVPVSSDEIDKLKVQIKFLQSHNEQVTKGIAQEQRMREEAAAILRTTFPWNTKRARDYGRRFGGR
jgi:hypothetical protein